MSGERHPSCLVAKLSYYTDLSEEDEGYLAMLEKDEQKFSASSVVYASEVRGQNLYVVKSGWLFSYIMLTDGRRQILKVYHPGDVIGFPDIAFDRTTSDLQAAGEVCLCPFPKKELDVIFSKSPRLTALLFSLSARDQVILLDLLRALGRMSAIERLAYFLLDTQAKLRVTCHDLTDTFRLPLTQTEIGDLLGLTNVYVSKSLGRLEEDGLIERKQNAVRILKEAELRRQVDFFDRYNTLDTSWFPQPGQAR